MALFPLMAPGRNIVASTRLYGGTVTQFGQTIRRFGWSATFVDLDDEALELLPLAIEGDPQRDVLLLRRPQTRQDLALGAIDLGGLGSIVASGRALHLETPVNSGQQG